MSTMAAQIPSLTIVFSTVYSGTDQRKHQSSASLAFVQGIHQWPVNSPHKGPVTQKMFPFDDVIMEISSLTHWILSNWQLPMQQCWSFCTNDDILCFREYTILTNIHICNIHGSKSILPFNTLWPEHYGGYFADNNIECIFLHVPKSLNDKRSVLV